MGSLGSVALYAGFAYANAYSRRGRPAGHIRLGSIAQIVLSDGGGAAGAYVAAAADLPLRDAELMAADRGLGLDWAAYVAFGNDRPAAAGWLTYGLAMIRWPLFVSPVHPDRGPPLLPPAGLTLAFALA